MNKAKLNNFIKYVLYFYGKDGLYDMGATREQVAYATGVLVTTISLTPNSPTFEGDTVDREKVRTILENTFGLVEFIS
jgi:hypothetical protein